MYHHVRQPATERDIRAAAVAAKSLGMLDIPPVTWEAQYIALMARAAAILDRVDGLHDRGHLTGESPIDEAQRLIDEAKALRKSSS